MNFPAISNLPALSKYGIWWRGVLYVSIVMLSEAQPFLEPDVVIYWPQFIGKLLLVGGVTLRAYLDQSPAQGEATDRTTINVEGSPQPYISNV